jgi:hypothetical protein
MSKESILAEARLNIERALGGIDTLHLGPTDYNVFTTTDYLRTAAKLVEQYGQIFGRTQENMEQMPSQVKS